MHKKITLLLSFVTTTLIAQIEKAPPRAEGEYANRLIIRGVTLINSTGEHPVGPVDILV